MHKTRRQAQRREDKHKIQTTGTKTGQQSEIGEDKQNTKGQAKRPEDTCKTRI